MGEYLGLRLFGFRSDGGQARIWVHASSVGEVQAITPLVEAFLQRGEQVLFTSFTATGYRTIEHNFADRVVRGVIPLDNYWFCRRFFKQHRLKLGLIMETELWPELLYQASCRGLPLLQVNARLSEKSSAAGPLARRLLRTTLGYFSAILTRSDRDREVLLSLGARDERIRVLGNLKTAIVDSRNWERLISRDYVLFASSHRGEERQLLDARPAGFDALLVIAPRHPDRAASIVAELEQRRISFAVRSRAQAIGPATEVYLADTLGEMKPLMAHARVVVMGGSFNQTGGHNLLEPASLGCATITGPSDSNIAADIEMLGDGILQVEDMAQCWRRVTQLLADPAQAGHLGETARHRLAQQPNMVAKYLDAVDSWL